jgi:hypothetical protein
MQVDQQDTRSHTWDDLYPDGAIRYYEGDDPDGFAAEIKAEFGFDVTEGGEEQIIDKWGGDCGSYRWAWNEECGFSFLIPSGYVEAVYGSERWPLGS